MKSFYRSCRSLSLGLSTMLIQHLQAISIFHSSTRLIGNATVVLWCGPFNLWTLETFGSFFGRSLSFRKPMIKSAKEQFLQRPKPSQWFENAADWATAYCYTPLKKHRNFIEIQEIQNFIGLPSKVLTAGSSQKETRPILSIDEIWFPKLPLHCLV